MTPNSIKYYGIVEGFFSRPLPIWTYQERLNTLKFVTQYAPNINSYFYCPKDDPFITTNWSILYPSKQSSELNKIITYCSANKITFIYGLNPSLTGQSTTIATKLILNKFTQLSSLGCNNFCLLFDDIPMIYENNYNSRDIKTKSNRIVKVVNRVYSELREQKQNLWFCGPDYCYTKSNSINQILNSINPSVQFIWSGPQIFSRTINSRDLKQTQDIVGNTRELIWWSNYPVNDCQQSVNSRNMGSFIGPNPNVINQLSGIFVNPMRQCYSNLPFYISFSQYISSPKKYRPINSVTNLRLQTKYSKLFQKSIKPIISDQKIFNNLKRKILNGNSISYSEFSKYDWFPTETRIPRYVDEIRSILNSRLSLYSKYITPTPYLLKPITLFALSFKLKYPGSKKTNILPTDTEMYKKVIYMTISKERKLFIRFLNKFSLTTSKKISILKNRKNMNRFNINYYEI